jgi:hypothetical protein
VIAARRVMRRHGQSNIQGATPGSIRSSLAVLKTQYPSLTGGFLWRYESIAGSARLAACSFTHVLPGHGRRFTAPSPDAMRAAVLRAAG